MVTREIVKKLAELLYKDEGVYDGAVYFDWSSYDDDFYIPHLNIDGNRVNIEEFRVNKEGNEIIGRMLYSNGELVGSVGASAHRIVIDPETQSSMSSEYIDAKSDLMKAKADREALEAKIKSSKNI